MKKFVMSAIIGTAAFGLAACDNSPDTVEEGDTTIMTEPAPVETTDPMLTDPDTTTTDPMVDDTDTTTTTTDTTTTN